jgi:general secretion pathway protein A
MPQSRKSLSLQEYQREFDAVSLDVLPSPFCYTADPRFLYATAAYNDAYAALLAGIRERKGLSLLTGESGTGKTTLLSLLTSALDETIPVVLLHHLPQTFAEFISTLCDHLSLHSNKDTTDVQFDLLDDYLRARAFRGEPVVLFIDNAHRLDPSTLGHLETLLNRRGLGGNPLQVILAGQPQLEIMLRLPEARTVAKRVAVHCRLPRLTDEEVAAFIHHRLRTANWPQEHLFSPAAIARIIAHSRGVPHWINTICDSALRAAYASGHKTISESLIEEVVPSLRLQERETSNDSLPLPWNQVYSTQRPTFPPARQSWRDLQDLRTRLLRVSRKMFVVAFSAFLLLAGLSVWNRVTPSLGEKLFQYVQMAVTTLVGWNLWPFPAERNLRPVNPSRRASGTMALQTQPPTEKLSSAPQTQAQNPSRSRERRPMNASRPSVRGRVRSPVSSSTSRALLRSIEKGDVAAANRLLSSGVTVNARTKEGWTALILAAQQDLPNLARTLITRGANVNVRDKQGQTALIHAARKGHRQTVELLVNQGANVSVKDRTGRTALQYAQSPSPTPHAGDDKNEDYRAIAALLRQVQDRSVSETDKAAP